MRQLKEQQRIDTIKVTCFLVRASLNHLIFTSTFQLILRTFTIKTKKKDQAVNFSWSRGKISCYQLLCKLQTVAADSQHEINSSTTTYTVLLPRWSSPRCILPDSTCAARRKSCIQSNRVPVCCDDIHTWLTSRLCCTHTSSHARCIGICKRSRLLKMGL